jgi:PAS domain S-box-containing protein
MSLAQQGGPAGRVSDDVVAGLLRARPPHLAPRDAAAEARALARLAAQLAHDPHAMLQALADLARELCGADAVVVALVDAEPAGDRDAIRWQAVSGPLAQHQGARWPIDSCPCGASIAADSCVLLGETAKKFPSMQAVGLTLGETLGVPWHVRGRPTGSVSALMLDGQGRFDAEDLRLLHTCASFAAAAQQLADAGTAERTLEEQLRPVIESRDHLRREVEESRAAERALREHQALVDATLSISTVGVVYFDLNGSIGDVNEAFQRMSGYGAGELRALSDWRALSPPEFWDLTLAATSELRERGIAPPYTKQMIRKDGSRWWGLFAPARVADAGPLACCVVFVIDVTETKNIEARLAESEARFRALADAAPALVYQFDTDGGLIYLNGSSVDKGGARHGMVRPDDMDAYLRAVVAGIRDHDSYRQRIAARVRGGERRWFESHAAPWYAEGEQRGYVGISLDITAAVQAEEALKEADRRKDDFLATLAHELRNPLAPISNAVELLRRPDGRRQADRVVEMVGRQVRQMARLVDDLMEVSRITRGKVELRLERVAFADIVHSAVESSQPMIDRAAQRLCVVLPPAPLTLEADRVRLTQVFANLLNNASKYTDTGGRIWFDAFVEDGRLVATVRDTGIGIPQEALPRVFDMFAQAHRSTARGQGGLGIGLTMVRSLVEMHGGTVEARSGGAGQGSEFAVRLPLPLPLRAPDGQGAPRAEDGEPWTGKVLHGQRILVVDDNRDAADTLALLLEADGAEVRVAYDGRAALAAAATFVPHSVLLDIGMPGMDGFEVARGLRQDPNLTATRIVALTGWAQDADRRQTRNRGFSHHLIKPVGLEELHRVLGRSS